MNSITLSNWLRPMFCNLVLLRQLLLLIDICKRFLSALFYYTLGKGGPETAILECKRWPLMGQEQDCLHGYLSRVQFGRGSNESLQASKQQNVEGELDDMDQKTDRTTDMAS